MAMSQHRDRAGGEILKPLLGALFLGVINAGDPAFMQFGGLVAEGGGFINEFKQMPADSDFVVVLEFSAGNRLTIHNGMVGAVKVLDKIAEDPLFVRIFLHLDFGVAPADHIVIQENIAIGQSPDGHRPIYNSGFSMGIFLMVKPSCKRTRIAMSLLLIFLRCDPP